MPTFLETWLSTRAPTRAEQDGVPRALTERLAYAAALIKDAMPLEQEAHLLYREPAGVVRAVKVGAGLDAGRDLEHRLRLEDGRASKRHFRIAPAAGEAVLEDAGSRNGTYVNGRQIQRHVLRSGDVIEAGGTVLIFMDRL